MADVTSQFGGLAPVAHRAAHGAARLVAWPRVSGGLVAGVVAALSAGLALHLPTADPVAAAYLAPAGFGLGVLALVLGRRSRCVPALLLGALALAGAGFAILHGEGFWLLLAVLFGLLA